MTDLALAADFARPTEDDWLRLVDKALKGGDFERRLVARTADGIRIEPLYTRRHAISGRDGLVPGAAPFLRGTRLKDGAAWDIRQITAEPDPVAANAAILDDLAGGSTSVLLRVAAPGWSGISYEQASMARALEGVMLDVCPVALIAGEYTPDAAGSLMALWRSAGVADGERQGAFNYDPLGTLAETGALTHSVPKALEIAAGLVRAAEAMPGVTALRANGAVWHLGGATEAQELALVLASLVAYLRAAEAAGIAPGAALAKIAVTLAADADQFLTIAKFRAARRLVWQVATACGAGEAAANVSFTAETSMRMMTRRDPWVNMLRTTIAAAGAAMGGADAITVLPFSWVIGRPDGFARRIARNTHHVLLEEAGFGRVADPAGGSWYVERLTDDLVAKAWQTFQAIEAKGGLGAGLASGAVQDDLAKSQETRARLVATGRLEMTGTSAFPRLGDDGVRAAAWPADGATSTLNGAIARPLRLSRAAEPFETLRAAADAFEARTGAKPRVFLASLGPLAVHAGRTTWIRNLLAAGGIEGVGGDSYLTSADAGRAFGDSGATVACLCSSDDVTAELGEATASLLKTAGATRVYLAGRPKDDAALKAAGVDDMLYAGLDAVAALGALHTALGI